MKRYIRIVFFLLGMNLLFIASIYLLRNVNTSRKSICGVVDSLDMIYIEGSDTFTYYQLLCVWHEFGFTSYNYTAESMQAEAIKYMIKEAMILLGICGIIGTVVKQPVREWLSGQNIVFRWMVFYTLIFSVIIFGCYGYGYDAQAFIYQGF